MEVHRGFSQVAVVDAQVGRFSRYSLLLDKGVDLVFYDRVVAYGRIVSAF